MRDRKVQWLTVDDDKLESGKLSYETDDWMIVEP